MEEIEKELKRIADIENSKKKKQSDEENARCCSVCGNSKFVQKFRNVVGEIDGSMQGFFSIFGGSISGHIDGYTKTLPVLSCRECGNERKIKTWKPTKPKDAFWSFMHQFYFKVDGGFSDLYQVEPFFLQRPVETRDYMLDNPNYRYSFYNECPKWSTEVWSKAGFRIPKIKKRRFIFWEKEVYPSWKELGGLNEKLQDNKE